MSDQRFDYLLCSLMSLAVHWQPIAVLAIQGIAICDNDNSPHQFANFIDAIILAIACMIRPRHYGERFDNKTEDDGGVMELW